MSIEIQVDDETRAALLLFNERVEASAAEERGAKRVKKAERQKDEAAAVVRKLNDSPGASVEDKAEAEAAYKEAVENYQVVKANPNAAPPKPKKQEAATDDAPAAEDQTDDAPAAEDTAPAATTEDQTDDAPAAEDTAPAEVSADEEPAPAVAASGESE